MKKTTKLIAMSVLTIVACVSLISGATFALFTSESNINIAVTSGKVDVDASVSALWTYSNATDDIAIDAIDDWKPADAPSDGEFAGEWDNLGTVTYAAADGLGKLSLNNITPGDAVKFTFSVTNNSNVSIKYQIRMLAADDKYIGEEPDLYDGTKLSSALEVKLGDVTQKGLVYADSPWSAVIESTHSIQDTEVIIRLPKDAGNQYQHRSCEIALSVLAVQGNAKETSYCDEHGHNWQDDVCIYCGAENPFKSNDLHEESADTYTITGAPEGATELDIPAEINGKKVELAKDAFYGNTNITSVKIGEGITSWPEPERVHGAYQGLFTGCSSLEHVELPQSLEEIVPYSFYNCTSLKEIEIPDGVTAIGNYAFGNTGLESIDIPENVISIGGYSFYKTGLTNIEIPDNVTELGFGAFSYCEQLTSAKLGNGITDIQYSLFSNCPLLKNVELGNAVTTIGHTAFSATALETFTMPDSVTLLDYSAFYKCASLTNVVMGANLETIGNNAFDSCTSLETLTFNGAQLIEIGQFAFKNCKALTALDLPDSLTTIGAGVFQGCAQLASVEFGKAIQTIGSSAFEGCSALTEVSLPDSVTSIGGSAFYKCSKLTTVNIGTENSQLETFGSAAFLSCSKITEVHFAGTTEKWQAILANMSSSSVSPFVSSTKATIYCLNGNLNYLGK